MTDTERRGFPRPPYDPSLEARIEAFTAVVPSTITPDMIDDLRDLPTPDVDAILAAASVSRRDLTVPGEGGASLTLTVLARSDHRTAGPAIFFLHAGGMIMGDRFTGVEQLVGWVRRHDAVVATLEYRLAPEHPHPVPVEDCYAGLTWFHAHADDLRFDPRQLIVSGASAGGGLAAATTLMARDRNGPRLLGSMLLCPMLDERNDSVSARQFEGIGIWDRASNDTGWDALLGSRRGSDAVNAYASPALATDLAGLPPTFVDVGSAEVFRDEDVAYAAGIWAAGGVAELHVWPGGFHGFHNVTGDTDLGRAATAAQDDWLTRMFAGTSAHIPLA